MTVHATLPPIYKVQGYGITGFTSDDIQVGETYQLISDGGNILSRKVLGTDQPYKGSLHIERINEQDTKEVTTDAFVKVMRGRGIKG